MQNNSPMADVHHPLIKVAKYEMLYFSDSDIYKLGISFTSTVALKCVSTTWYYEIHYPVLSISDYLELGLA